MFDIGGWEFLLIAILGIIIIGPKELPGAIRTVSTFVRRARSLARDFQSGLEDMAREVELDKMTQEMSSLTDPDNDIRRKMEEAVDPDGDLKHAMEFDREWRDDDLVDFSETADEMGDTGNSIAPPPPEKTEKDKKKANPADENPAEGSAGKASEGTPDTPAEPKNQPGKTGPGSVA